MKNRAMKKILALMTALLVSCALLSVYGENAAWDCPECGRKNNTGNFCGGCAHPAPWMEEEQPNEETPEPSYRDMPGYLFGFSAEEIIKVAGNTTELRKYEHLDDFAVHRTETLFPASLITLYRNLEAVRTGLHRKETMYHWTTDYDKILEQWMPDNAEACRDSFFAYYYTPNESCFSLQENGEEFSLPGNVSADELGFRWERWCSISGVWSMKLCYAQEPAGKPGKMLWIELDGPKNLIMRWIISEPHTVNNSTDKTLMEIQRIDSDNCEWCYYNVNTGNLLPI